MRYLLALILSAIMLISQPSWATPGYRIDEQATAQAQWKPGESVDEGEVYLDALIGKHNFYRKFIGITDQGYAVVQDFYAESGNKFTDPYVVMQPERIVDIGLLKYELYKTGLFSLDGEVNFWYENGQKAAEGNYQNGMRHGRWTRWYENGQKWMEGNYQDDEEQGLWTFWDKSGKKTTEALFEAGEVVDAATF